MFTVKVEFFDDTLREVRLPLETDNLAFVEVRISPKRHRIERSFPLFRGVNEEKEGEATVHEIALCARLCCLPEILRAVIVEGNLLAVTRQEDVGWGELSGKIEDEIAVFLNAFYSDHLEVKRGQHYRSFGRGEGVHASPGDRDLLSCR